MLNYSSKLLIYYKFARVVDNSFSLFILNDLPPCFCLHIRVQYVKTLAMLISRQQGTLPCNTISSDILPFPGYNVAFLSRRS